MRRTVEAEQIVRYAKAMQGSLKDRKMLTGFDVSFHKALGLARRNPKHDLFIGAFSPTTRRDRSWQTRPGDTDLVDIVEQHLPIAGAVMKKDPARADLEMDKHFDLTINALIASGYQ